MSGAVLPPAVRPLRVSRVRSVRASGPSTGRTACALGGRRCSLWGWQKGVSGGVPSTVVRGVCGQALPLPARPLGGLLGSATHMLWARSHTLVAANKVQPPHGRAQPCG